MRVLRTERGESQQELAEVLGLSFQQVQKMETGSSRISPDKLVQIARYYDVEIAWFFSDLPPEMLPPSAGRAAAAEPVRPSRSRLRLEVGRAVQQVDDALLKPVLELLRSAAAARSVGPSGDNSGAAR